MNKNTFYSSNGGIYFLGFIGAIVYYFQIAQDFGGYVIGLIKAMLWPAFLVYDLLSHSGI